MENVLTQMAQKEDVMNERVPGGDYGAYLQQQAEVLRDKLAGHKLFSRWRGKFSDSLSVFAEEKIIGEGRSKSQISKKGSELMGEYLTLIRMLASFKLNGDDVAFQEMDEALRDEDYRMLGEDVPYEKTYPVTVVVFKPTIMFQIIQWMVRDDGLFELDTLIDPGRYPEISNPYPKKSTRNLGKILPSLKKGLYQGVNFWNCDLYAAIYEDIMKAFFIEEKGELGEMIQGTAWNFLHPLRGREIHGPGRDDGKHCKIAVTAYALRMEQSKMLSFFSRELQGEIASWQIHYPAALWNSCGRIGRVSFHPEKEHAMWKKLFPQYCSAGVSFGLGMMFNPDGRYVSHYEKMIAQDSEQKEIRAILYSKI